MFEFSQWLLLIVCALTSAMTAGFGVGGGVVLLAVMPHFFAPSLVIPIHGATQLMSNGSRMVLDWRGVRWDIIRSYLPGSIIGAVLGYFMLDKINFEHLPLVLGVFILLCTWTRIVQTLGIVLQNMFLLGVIQTFLSLFVGAIGLILPPILLKKNLSKNTVISTQAVMMTTMHAFKVASYVAAGFAFSKHITTLLLMLTGSAIGSYCGRWLRGVVPEQTGVMIMKVVVTVLALQLIAPAAQAWL